MGRAFLGAGPRDVEMRPTFGFNDFLVKNLGPLRPQGATIVSRQG